MTYNVFGGTLNPAQSSSLSAFLVCIIILSSYGEVDKVEVISIPSNVA